MRVRVSASRVSGVRAGVIVWFVAIDGVVLGLELGLGLWLALGLS